MKQFLIKSILYISAILVVHIIAAYFAGGATDPYYLRFTSPVQSSLIIGSSRSAQGLLPASINPIISNEADNKGIYNFSFTAHDSPYGPVYLEAIKSKLKPEVSNGIFIISVSPWLISSTSQSPENIETFRENEGVLAGIDDFSVRPNFQYLIDKYHHGWIKLFRSTRTTTQLQDDGWLEITVPMDGKSIAKRKLKKINAYKNNSLRKHIRSQVRINALEEIIQYLEGHGDVFVVRLPIDKEILSIEDSLMLGFNHLMLDITQSLNANYYDFSSCSGQYQFIDGVHLYKESGMRISQQIANLIIEDNKLSTFRHYKCN